MQGHAAFDNDQPQAGAGDLFSVAAAVKSFEQAGLFVGGYPNASIGDSENRFTPVSRQLKPDGTVRGRELNGVGEQVG